MTVGQELARDERKGIRRLVTGWCANYDSGEDICLPLDCGSGPLGTTGFRQAQIVTPLPGF